MICTLMLAWQLWITFPAYSHTSLALGTIIAVLVEVIAAAAVVVHYRHGAITKGQFMTGLISVALSGTALMSTSGSAGSVGDVFLLMCGIGVWIVLTLWVIIRTLLRPQAELETP